jgi:hypothetical protein
MVLEALELTIFQLLSGRIWDPWMACPILQHLENNVKNKRLRIRISSDGVVRPNLLLHQHTFVVIKHWVALFGIFWSISLLLIFCSVVLTVVVGATFVVYRDLQAGRLTFSILGGG